MPIRSPLRLRCIAILAQGGQDLRDDLPYRAKRLILVSAYPFGDMGGREYSIWLREVCRHVKPNVIPRACLMLTNRGLVCICDRHHTRARGFRGTCLVCGQLQVKRRRLAKDPRYQSFRQAMVKGDTVARAALKDWLTEQEIVFEEQTWNPPEKETG